MAEYTVMIEKGENNYEARVSDLDGCVSPVPLRKKPKPTSAKSSNCT